MNVELKNARLILNWFLTESGQGSNDFELSELKEMFETIKNNYLDMIVLVEAATDKSKTDSDLYIAWDIVQTCFEAVGDGVSDYDFYELFDLINEISLNRGGDDFYIDSFSGGECRLIDEDEIDQIWEDSLIEQIKECYDLSNVPSFVEIDWQATAENCKVDGKGHHFGSYDGSEHYCNGYYIFKTN